MGDMRDVDVRDAWGGVGRLAPDRGTPTVVPRWKRRRAIAAGLAIDQRHAGRVAYTEGTHENDKRPPLMRGDESHLRRGQGLSEKRCKWLDTPTGWLARRSH